jgi:hypothetical protein
MKEHRINFYKDLISTKPQVLNLLNEGIEQFYIEAGNVFSITRQEAGICMFPNHQSKTALANEI